MTKRSFVIFGGAELPWIFPLGAELAQAGRATLIRLGASWSPTRSPSWPYDDDREGLTKLSWTYPPGFNGRLAFAFTRIVRERLEEVVRDLEVETGAAPYVVTPEPRFEKYTSGVASERLVYLNYDEYATYDETGSRRPNPDEERLVERAGTIVCSSRYQRDGFRERFHDIEDRFFHLPHGVHSSFLNPSPDKPPSGRSVCVVGSLTARYDWDLIDEVVTRLPDVEFRFAGEIGRGSVGSAAPDWERRRANVLARPNVRHVTGLRHRETAIIYWKSALNWMPYRADLAFVKASCPLKISDGLASGRPIVSADVPECHLHSDWIQVYRSADAAIALMSESLRMSGSAEARSRTSAQLEYAASILWSNRARQLIAILERKPAGASREGSV